MIIRADTNDENKVPDVGDTFVVAKVEKVAAFWIIELKKRMKSPWYKLFPSSLDRKWEYDV